MTRTHAIGEAHWTPRDGFVKFDFIVNYYNCWLSVSMHEVVHAHPTHLMNCLLVIARVIRLRDVFSMSRFDVREDLLEHGAPQRFVQIHHVDRESRTLIFKMCEQPTLVDRRIRLGSSEVGGVHWTPRDGFVESDFIVNYNCWLSVSMRLSMHIPSHLMNVRLSLRE